MTSSEQLIAYVVTLGALIVTLLGAMLVVAFVPGLSSHVADFGIGTVTGGLIGILRIPSTRNNPVVTTDSGDVNLQPQGEAK